MFQLVREIRTLKRTQFVHGACLSHLSFLRRHSRQEVITLFRRLILAWAWEFLLESVAFEPWNTERFALLSAGVAAALALEFEGAYIQLSMAGQIGPLLMADVTAEFGRAAAGGFPL